MGEPTERNYVTTEILDYEHPVVGAFRKQIPLSADKLTALREGYQYIAGSIAPVYTVDEYQPVSTTIEKGAGSCSQRMACLEAVARALGIATRARGLWISGSFWNPRFRFTKRFIPKQILLIWPQFYIEDKWIDFDDLHVPDPEREHQRFSNSGETLFDAVATTRIDFTGKHAASADTEECGSCNAVSDLSEYFVSDAGMFDARDDLLQELGSFQHTLKGLVFEKLFGGRKSN